MHGFDDLLESALKKVDHSFHDQSQKLTQEEKQKFETAVLEKLPEDFHYEVNECNGTELSKFKLKVTTDNVSPDNLEGWLAEFQALNGVTLKVKAKKKETKGYSIQHYYRCQHDTRRWSPSKDPQRKLKCNPAARVKNTNCPFQLVIKINTQNNCVIDIDHYIDIDILNGVITIQYVLLRHQILRNCHLRVLQKSRNYMKLVKHHVLHARYLLRNCGQTARTSSIFMSGKQIVQLYQEEEIFATFINNIVGRDLVERTVKC